MTLHHRDLLREHLDGARLGLGNLLGIPLDIDHFLTDAVTAQYTDLTALQEELTHCATEVVVLTGGHDGADGSFPAPPMILVDDVISRLQLDYSVNELQLKRLKKRKLMLKDQITRLESELIPDLNA